MTVWRRTRFYEKIAKICVFWLFNRLFYSGRNGDIWPKIGHLGAEEAQKTIEHQKIVFRAHFEKIEKNRHFYPKNTLKNFQSWFSPADLARATNRYRSKTGMCKRAVNRAGPGPPKNSAGRAGPTKKFSGPGRAHLKKIFVGPGRAQSENYRARTGPAWSHRIFWSLFLLCFPGRKQH